MRKKKKYIKKKKCIKGDQHKITIIYYKVNMYIKKNNEKIIANNINTLVQPSFERVSILNFGTVTLTKTNNKNINVIFNPVHAHKKKLWCLIIAYHSQKSYNNLGNFWPIKLFWL